MGDSQPGIIKEYEKLSSVENAAEELNVDKQQIVAWAKEGVLKTVVFRHVNGFQIVLPDDKREFLAEQKAKANPKKRPAEKTIVLAKQTKLVAPPEPPKPADYSLQEAADRIPCTLEQLKLRVSSGSVKAPNDRMTQEQLDKCRNDFMG